MSIPGMILSREASKSEHQADELVRPILRKRLSHRDWAGWCAFPDFGRSRRTRPLYRTLAAHLQRLETGIGDIDEALALGAIEPRGMIQAADVYLYRRIRSCTQIRLFPTRSLRKIRLETSQPNTPTCYPWRALRLPHESPTCQPQLPCLQLRGEQQASWICGCPRSTRSFRTTPSTALRQLQRSPPRFLRASPSV
jgi:hypothetical protein